MTTSLIEQAITAHWGERCPEFDADCACCKAWAEIDALKVEATQGWKREEAGEWSAMVDPLVRRFEVAGAGFGKAVHNAEGAAAIAKMMRKMARLLDGGLANVEATLDQRLEARLSETASRERAQAQPDFAPGERAFFEYCCTRSHDSDHARHWYHSHQWVEIVAIAEEGADGSLQDRGRAGMPRVYTVRWTDGFSADVFDHELFAEPKFVDKRGAPPPFSTHRPSAKPAYIETIDEPPKTAAD